MDCRQKFIHAYNSHILCPNCGNTYQFFDDAEKPEMVNHPKHYNSLGATCQNCGSDIECIDVVEHMSFNIGSAVKYAWRLDEKFDDVEDLKKAIWYLQRELDKREQS